MSSTTVASSCHGSSLNDVSFSSYLSSAEETYVRELGESNHNLSSGIPVPQERRCSRKTTAEDGEIDVFSADTYFNGEMEDANPRNADLGTRNCGNKIEEQVNGGHLKPRIQSRAPSICSKSSWNSQIALLRTVLRNSSRKDKTNRAQGMKFFAILGCNCSCSDKKSLDVDGHVYEGYSHSKVSSKATKTSLEPAYPISTNKLQLETGKFDVSIKREDRFASQISCSPDKMLSTEEQERARKSLEVFGRRELGKGGKTFSLERRRSMFPWGASRREYQLNSQTPLVEIQSDVESEASSDLFELECLSCSGDPVLARCATPASCYPPSEASIVWSVVTASAADFSAALSDSEDQQISAGNRGKISPVTRAAGNNEHPKWRPVGILAGCKSWKAVSVAERDPLSRKGKI
ncbi:hypothetical protein Nepgr_028007 [Nepenthes gracilis]|uniref:Protein PHYTOCHROME KINASE SUBSTRATE 1-like n=1 Tax=Nepenthes gracilis TaxID=150966 RepID=A0AAD3TC04_NEPGR|nr:hypothetical protein Nepgr_028007 [Nepenthes gracilis]